MRDGGGWGTRAQQLVQDSGDESLQTQSHQKQRELGFRVWKRKQARILCSVQMFRGAGKLRWPGVAFCEAGTASPPRHARTPQHVYKAYPPAIHTSHQSRTLDARRRSSHAAAAFKLCGSLQGVFVTICLGPLPVPSMPWPAVRFQRVAGQ
ncbi:hypothetical protein COCSADRAFT_290383 [Bipolaris sorokiniana ND90Pr]|uniref:Uncharacterized protein n=1 Tax=Cochliobolus sativus (strain ND90Pr / ATCC 201652) TaxID=665912 RepID=M2SZ24_COCSN|nr:uncharacterized protein COCSADRAFT_290383 [Bipolaris sorokiniana ND90Pr]EMD67560.1 hypothetical protein COCSADRAFT_290383 [Bipolaris sorokiniana ND90Pr]